jgi:hypothetical protein
MRAGVLGLTALAALPALALADVTVRVLPPEPPKGFEKNHISKAALPGQEIRLWYAQILDPDCNVGGTMQTEILQAPKHGQARISEDAFFGSFPPSNIRFHCNAKKAPGREVFYISDAGFHGHDQVVFQNSTSEGRIRKWIVDIDVR